MEYKLDTDDHEILTQLVQESIASINRLKYYCKALEKENSELKKQLQDKLEEIPSCNLKPNPQAQ